MKQYLYRIKNHFWFIVHHKDTPYIVGLVLLVSIIAICNFPSWGNWQTGWDNLHPEFNFILNIKRAFFTMWQEFQGLGLVGGHGYAATLPHTLLLWMLSLLLPTFLLRPIFTFSMLFVGSIGIYFLTKRLLYRHNTKIVSLASFLAGVTYTLHLITMQNFYIQLEAFIVHFAFLPWILWSIMFLWKKPNWKSWLIFIMLNLASATAGFIPPLFVVECGVVGILLVFLLFSDLKKLKYRIKHIILILTIMFFLNAYWLIPVAYYTKSYSQNYLNAYNNLQSTENFIIQNEKYGTLKNVALGKSFLFDANDALENGSIVPLLTPWNNHIQQPLIKSIGYFLFVLACVGCFLSLIKKSSAAEKALAVIFIIFVTLLATNTPPFSWVSSLLQQISPIFRQAFRVAYTKFSIAYDLTFVIMMAFSLIQIFIIINKKILNYLISGGLVTILCFYSFPIFQGYFTYPRTRIAIPQEYFNLTEYLKTQPNGRVMNVPQGWNWGWTINTWGYTGSGFLWYGMEQPIMDRAFDVWSPRNEQYFWELQYALYSNNLSLLEQIINKYDIQWILYDESIVPYTQPRYVFQEAKIRKLVNSLPNLTLEKTWGKLHLYRVNQLNTTFVSSQDSLPNIGPVGNWMIKDQAFNDIGSYVINDEIADRWYPFRNMFSYRNVIPEGKGIEKITNGYKIEGTSPPFEYSNTSIEAKEVFIPIVITIEKLTTSINVQISQFQNHDTQRKPLTIYGEWSEKIPTDTNYINLYLNDTTVGPIEINTKKIFTLLGLQNSSNNFVVTDQKSNILMTKSFTSKYLQEVEGVDTFVPYVDEHYSYNSAYDSSFFTHNQHSCIELTQNIQPTADLVSGKAIEFLSDNSDICFDISLPKLPQSIGYLVELDSQHDSGRSLSFAVINATTRKVDMEVQLPNKAERTRSFVIVPPMQSDGLGYSLKFINKKGEQDITKNYLFGVRVTPFPFDTLASVVLSKNNLKIKDTKINELSVTHPNPTYYTFEKSKTNNNLNQTLTLNQSFDSGWKAYVVSCAPQSGPFGIVSCGILKGLPFLFGKELKNHVLVNNWANGWELDSCEPQRGPIGIVGCGEEQQIVIFFLPQLLQWFGFVLLPLPFLFLLRMNKRIH